MSFLRNSWYVAAWSSELKPGMLLARRLLDEPVVFFRDPAGAAQALLDRCPHRFAPLSMGKLCDGLVQCPYHGLQFDKSGQCVHNPHGNVIPKASQVKAYPIVEKFSLLWIWMGEPDRADPTLIPDFFCQDAAFWHVGEGYLHFKADYQLGSDNVLDVSHFQYLHPDTLGSKTLQEGRSEVAQDGNRVWSKRFFKGETLNNLLYVETGLPVGSLVDRRFDVRWDAPSVMLLTRTAVPSGDAEPQPINAIRQAHLFTPETSRSTHYWFSHCLQKAIWPNGAERVRRSVQFLEMLFRKDDLAMIEAVQERMGDEEFWSLEPVLIAPDGAAIRARRILQQLIESERRPPPPALSD